MFYGYNTEKVPQANVPKSALDFLKLDFRGKVVTVYPTEIRLGFHMEKYMANESIFYPRPSGCRYSPAIGH
jgi:hypothetical protein